MMLAVRRPMHNDLVNSQCEAWERIHFVAEIEGASILKYAKKISLKKLLKFKILWSIKGAMTKGAVSSLHGNHQYQPSFSLRPGLPGATERAVAAGLIWRLFS